MGIAVEYVFLLVHQVLTAQEAFPIHESYGKRTSGLQNSPGFPAALCGVVYKTDRGDHQRTIKNGMSKRECLSRSVYRVQSPGFRHLSHGSSRFNAFPDLKSSGKPACPHTDFKRAAQGNR